MRKFIQGKTKANSRIGLGLMGMHEWLLQRGYKYEMVDELKTVDESLMKRFKVKNQQTRTLR